MDSIFWAGLFGAVAGAAAGSFQKRTRPERAAPVAAAAAVGAFALVSIILALFD